MADGFVEQDMDGQDVPELDVSERGVAGKNVSELNG